MSNCENTETNTQPIIKYIMPKKYVTLTYIWIDAFNNLRSKTKVLYEDNFVPNLSTVPNWTYDGSSCGQAEGFKSDIIIKPQFICTDPFRNHSKCHAYLVMCDTYNPDGTPHATNKRYECADAEEKSKDFQPIFGIEQEYFVYDAGTNLPYDWKSANVASDLYLNKQGPYYCGVGANNACVRHIMDDHLDYCMLAGLHIRGTNLEVAKSQAEFQIGELGPTAMGDELWVARYILDRVCEKYYCYVNYHPKLFECFNGSGAHTNFSTKQMREDGGLKYIHEACDKLREKHSEHIAVYGNVNTNKLRLTGLHETSSMDKFSFEVSDRGRSCRIPLHVASTGKGYLEDRRPPSDAEPYTVVTRIIKTVCLNEN